MSEKDDQKKSDYESDENDAPVTSTGDGDNEILREINQGDNRKRILFSILAVLLVAVICVCIYLLFFYKKGGLGEISSEESSAPHTSSELVSEAESSVEESSEALSEEESSESASEEESSAATEESEVSHEYVSDQYADHGWVNNSLGYTYLYYGIGLEDFTPGTAARENYIAYVNRIADKVYGKANLFHLIVPTRVEYMSIPASIYGATADNFINSSQKNFLNTVYSATAKNVTNINIYSLFEEKYDAGEKLYFDSDTNYTALAAYYAYQEFCTASENSAVDLSSLSKLTYEGFLGKFYTATKATRFTDYPDEILYYNVDEAFPASVTMYKNGAPYRNRRMVYSTVSAPSNGYYLFLGDEAERFEIMTSNDSGKAILVVGDSAAAPFVGFLAANYTHITFVNPLYCTDTFDSIFAAENYSDVLILDYSTSYKGSKNFISGLKTMIPDPAPETSTESTSSAAEASQE